LVNQAFTRISSKIYDAFTLFVLQCDKMTIVKEIVDLHRGRIEVESRMDEGTSFRVWLPLETNGR